MLATIAPEEPAESDEALLRKVAAGETAAFSGLVERHQGRLLRVCERLLGNPEDARDAAQEVFFKVFRKASAFEPRGEVFTWLYRIATNHCLNRLRRRKILRFVGLAGDDPEREGELDPVDPGADPERALAARRRWRTTRKVIAGLPANQRTVLILAKFEGLSYRQIAEVLEITEGAVESRLFRAMQRLQTQAKDPTGVA